MATRDQKVGDELRRRRKAAGLSLRELARKVDMQPAYLSKVETGQTSASEKLVGRMASALGEDPDAMALCAAQITDSLYDIVARHPDAFADLIRNLKKAPKNAILRLVREVRDGEW